MKLNLFLVLLFGVFNANADTVCSTAEQNLTYHFDMIERGMPPVNGDLLSKETLVFNTVDYGINEVVQGLDYRPDFSINFDLSTKQTLHFEMYRNGSKEVYSVLVESINTTPGGPISLLPVNQFVICTENFVAVP